MSTLSKIAESVGGLNKLLSLGGSPSAIGLSIGTSSVKMVELKKTRKAWKMLHYGIINLPEDAIVNREIVNQIAVVESIKSLIGRVKLKSKNVCSSLSGTSVIVKPMQLEVPNVRELQDQVFWEAEQYLPFEASDVYMDYQLLNRSKDGNTDVLLVACKRNVLDSYMAVISDSGLKPKIMDLDFFALQHLLEASYPVNPSEAVAMVDIGASSTKIVVIHNGVPVFTKDSVLGGRNLTLDIQKHLGVSFEDAEMLKVGSEQTPQEVSDLMKVAIENISSELKRALDFYNASSSKAPVSYVLLAGGGAKLPDLPKTVEEVLGLPTQIVNPFNSITYDPSVFTQDYLSSIAPIAAIPIGLAIRAGAN